MGNNLSDLMQTLNQSKPERGYSDCGSTSSSPDYTSLGIGSCSCPQNAPPLTSCVFYSPRMRDQHDGKRTETETKSDHFTPVHRDRVIEEKEVEAENRKYFDEVLVKHPDWGAFFSNFGDLEVGEKIGDGGQAEIFVATMPGQVVDHSTSLVVKIFPKDQSLRDLEKLWPTQMLSAYRGDDIIPSGNDRRRGHGFPFRNILGGVFLREGEYRNRFAFVMRRYSGDLRTLIDRRMLELLGNNKHGPPFDNIVDVYRLIRGASNDMRKLHRAGVIHRDIKAANLLLASFEKVQDHELPDLMDFECSLGITGTGFWRAPEIIRQSQERLLSGGSHEVVFTKEADIYSFGMLCYEIITGCMPLEAYSPRHGCNHVLKRGRPILPKDLNHILKKLVVDCWQHDPQKRPSAEEVCKRVEEFAHNIGLNPRLEPFW